MRSRPRLATALRCSWAIYRRTKTSVGRTVGMRHIARSLANKLLLLFGNTNNYIVQTAG